MIWALSLCLLTRCYLCSRTTCGFCFVRSARIIDCAVPTGSWSCSCLHIWGWNTNSRSGLISLQNIQSVQKLIIKVDVHCPYVRCWQSILKFFLIHIKTVFQLVPVCDYSHLHVLHTKTRMTLSGHPSFLPWSCLIMFWLKIKFLVAANTAGWFPDFDFKIKVGHVCKQSCESQFPRALNIFGTLRCSQTAKSFDTTFRLCEYRCCMVEGM